MEFTGKATHSCSICLKKSAPVFRFPNPKKDLARFKHWNKAVANEKYANLTPEQIFSRGFVCSKHFHQDDFVTPHKLKADAVPHLHLPKELSKDCSPESAPIDLPPAESSPSVHTVKPVFVTPAKDVPDKESTPRKVTPTVIGGVKVSKKPSAGRRLFSRSSESSNRENFPEALCGEDPVSLQPHTELAKDLVPLTSSSESVPSTSGIQGSSKSQPSTSGIPGRSESQPSTSGIQGSSESQPSTSGIEDSRQHRMLGSAQQIKSRAVKSTARGPSQPRVSSLLYRVKIKKLSVSFSTTEALLYQEAKRLQKRVTRLENKAQQNRASLAAAKKLSGKEAFRNLCENMSASQKRFIESQLCNVEKKTKGRIFTFDQKADAIAIWKSSRRTYKMLSKMYILPSISTLKNTLRKVSIQPGISKAVFQVLKGQINQMEGVAQRRFRMCNLLFDELSLQPHLDYLPHDDKVIGFEDDGRNTSSELADHACIFMLKGIFKRWKQPVGFAFTKNAVKAECITQFVKEIVDEAMEAGLIIVAIICDQGTTNVKAISNLQEETRRLALQNDEEVKENSIVINNHAIVPIYDPPHLLKSVRNNLLTKDLEFKIGNTTMVASWAHIMAAYDIDRSRGSLRSMYKLSDLHVIPNKIKKMKVSLCSQVFSKTVASFIDLLAGAHSPSTHQYGFLPQEASETSQLLKFFDEIFDSVNGGFGNSKGKPLRGLVGSKTPHLRKWLSGKEVFSSMRFIKQKPNDREKPPCLSGWVKTLEGFSSIKSSLAKHGFNTFPARAFNQDSLENFNGQLRQYGGRNINPTCNGFLSYYKSLLVRNFASYHSAGANCEADSDATLTSLQSFLDQSGPSQSTSKISDRWFPPEVQLESTVDFLDANIVSYIGGFLVKHLKLQSLECQTCAYNLFHAGEPDPFYHKFTCLKEYTDVKKLQYIRIDLIKTLMQMYHHLEIYTPSVLSKSNICKRLTSQLRLEMNFNFERCEHSDDLEGNIVTKFVNLYIFSYTKKLNNIIMGKELPSHPNDLENKLKILYEKQRKFSSARHHTL